MIGDTLLLDGRPHQVTFESMADYGEDGTGPRRRLKFVVQRVAPVEPDQDDLDPPR